MRFARSAILFFSVQSVQNPCNPCYRYCRHEIVLLVEALNDLFAKHDALVIRED